LSEVEPDFLVEVFRNQPPGDRCKELTENAHELEGPKPDVDVEFHDIDSSHAESLGVTDAPSVMVNRKILINGVASVEGLRKALKKAKPDTAGIMFTRGPGNEEVEALKDFVKTERGIFDHTVLLLLNDGVWLARKESPVKELIQSILENGEVLCVQRYLDEAGIGKDELIPEAEIIDLEGCVEKVFDCGQVLSL